MLFGAIWFTFLGVVFLTTGYMARVAERRDPLPRTTVREMVKAARARAVKNSPDIRGGAPLCRRRVLGRLAAFPLTRVYVDDAISADARALRHPALSDRWRRRSERSRCRQRYCVVHRRDGLPSLSVVRDGTANGFGTSRVCLASPSRHSSFVAALACWSLPPALCR